MANVTWQDFRPRFLYSNAVSIPMTEGDPATVLANVIDETGLPQGYYKLTFIVTWIQPNNKYMQFQFTSTALAGGGPVLTKESHVSSPGINDFTTSVVLPVLGGDLDIDVNLEFPSQSGAASGSVESIQVLAEKWGEFPTP